MTIINIVMKERERERERESEREFLRLRLRYHINFITREIVSNTLQW